MVKRRRLSETPRDATFNAYRGWTGIPGTTIDAIQAADTTPESFWKQYASQRKPVILKGHSLSTNLDQLADQAGDVIVDVESRFSDTAYFGMGNKHKMDFKSFINAIQKGQSNLYLTTQKAAMGPDGQPELASPLLSRLLNLNDEGGDTGDGARNDDTTTTMNKNTFPLRPSVTGNLVPHAINLWMGCTSTTNQGSSSRLHHDFHDNIYHMLQGRKTFLLYPPSTATCMYTKGTICHIHPNGRIVYTSMTDMGNIPKADGSTEMEVGIWLRRTKAEEALAEAEAAVEKGDVGSRAMLEKAEEELDDVLMRALQTGGDLDDEEDAGDGDGGGTQDPDSFSMVDLKLTDKQLRQKFPLFPGKSAAIYADIKEGDVLYLPAGWFHEVISFGSRNGNVHCAVNYWFYPPDNINNKDEDGYKRPYVSLYWPEFWKEREARYRSDGGVDLMMMEEHEEDDCSSEEEEETASSSEEEDDDREMSPLPPTQKMVYGYFGYGRRRELFRFIGLKDCTGGESGGGCCRD